MTRISIYWTITLIVYLLFLYFMPNAIFYSTDWTAFCLIFFVLPFLVYRTLKTFEFKTRLSILFAVLSILIVGPTFGLFHQYTETNELKRNGVWSKAIVVEEKKSDSKGYQGWLIESSFKINDKTCYTTFENDEKNIYRVGDTIDIIYLPDFPKIYELSSQWTGK